MTSVSPYSHPVFMNGVKLNAVSGWLAIRTAEQ